jgi:hypothetical protein
MATGVNLWDYLRAGSDYQREYPKLASATGRTGQLSNSFEFRRYDSEVVHAPKKPRLRFDKVALRVVGDLKRTLGDGIPEGKTLIVTISAPIRLPSKTVAALEAEIRTRMTRQAAKLEFNKNINGNSIRVRLVSHGFKGRDKLIGFVHNLDLDPKPLVAATTKELLER